MKNCEKRCCANNDLKKWSNIKEMIFPIRCGFLDYLMKCNTTKSIRSGEISHLLVASLLKDFKVQIKKFLWILRTWANNQIGVSSFLSILPTNSANMTKICIVICIPNRKADTERINYKTCFGRIHCSHRWICLIQGFAIVDNLGSEKLPVNPPYVHETVNHSLFFRDALTGAATNHVVADWAYVKKSFKMGG
ncbi:hypothetical protein RF11_14129 [Thelohanellus kitauei]|uniref:Uncharacterized protein n=1 Tax=Thelohanellus kitauei TaxID=669202 RepID=A0A0C2J3F3_THEKT|nr:hypothetical protein RF11_14129 [Thelohanellus kitauei]